MWWFRPRKYAFVTLFDKLCSMRVYNSQDGPFVKFGDGSVAMLRAGGICDGCKYATAWAPQSGWGPNELRLLRSLQI